MKLSFYSGLLIAALTAYDSCVGVQAIKVDVDSLDSSAPVHEGDADESVMAQADSSAATGAEAKTDAEFFGAIHRLFHPPRPPPRPAPRNCPAPPSKSAMSAMIEAEAKKRMERDRENQRKYERIAAKRWKKKIKEVKKQCKRDRMRRRCRRRRQAM